MIKLYEYLISNYKPNEPIFVSDIQLSVSDVNLRQMFKVLELPHRCRIHWKLYQIMPVPKFVR